jgi:hypothetical protein
MLEIKANKSIYLDGQKMNIDNDNCTIEEILLSSLDIPVTLDKDLTIGDLVHVFYDIKDFILYYCSEEYENARSLIQGGILLFDSEYIEITKYIELNSNKLNINLKSNIIQAEKQINRNVKDLKIKFNDNIVDEDDILKDGINAKAEFTLIEIISVIYEDFLYVLKKENVLI